MPSAAKNLKTYVFSDLLEHDGYVPPESMFDLLINIKDKDGKVDPRLNPLPPLPVYS